MYVTIPCSVLLFFISILPSVLSAFALSLTEEADSLIFYVVVVLVDSIECGLAYV